MKLNLLTTALITTLSAPLTFAGVINIDCESVGGLTAAERGRIGKGTIWNSVSNDHNNLVDQFGRATPVDIDFSALTSAWSGNLGNDLQNDYIDSFASGGSTISGYIRDLRPDTFYRVVIYTSDTIDLHSVYLGPTLPFFIPVVGLATPGPLPGDHQNDYVILSFRSDSSGDLKFTLTNSGGDLAKLSGMQIQGWLPGESRVDAYQSDLSISKRPKGGYKGEGLFSHRPTPSQTRSARSKRGKKVTHYVSIANAGDAPGFHELDADRTDRKVRRTYRNAGNANITAQIIAANYQLNLSPEGHTYIRVDSKPKRRAGNREITNVYAAPVDHDVNATTDVVTSRLRQVR